jgi:hypothetical protein
MLTENDLNRIKSEEIFREEIRKKISEKEKSSKIWTFLNSSFGIWLLSTVVVGLIVYFHNENKVNNEIFANNTALINKLETEASNRLQLFKLALENQGFANVYYWNEEMAYMIDGELIKDGSLSQRKPIYIFPEYKERTMNSLLYEIGRLTDDKNRKLKISQARKLLTNIQKSLINMEKEPRSKFAMSQEVQYVLQKAQIEPKKLTDDEKKILTEYRKNEKIYNNTVLAEYNKRIKNKMKELVSSFQNDSYLKEMSDK